MPEYTQAYKQPLWPLVVKGMRSFKKHGMHVGHRYEQLVAKLTCDHGVYYHIWFYVVKILLIITYFYLSNLWELNALHESMILKEHWVEQLTSKTLSSLIITIMQTNFKVVLKSFSRFKHFTLQLRMVESRLFCGVVMSTVIRRNTKSFRCSTRVPAACTFTTRLSKLTR